MPHKETVIPLLDELSESALAIGAVNTIVNTAGRLVGHNTDALAVEALLADIDPMLPTALLGSGGMAKAIAHALAARAFTNVTIVGRNKAARKMLASKFQFREASEVPTNTDFLLNATPIGMAPDPVDRMPFTEPQLARALVILDSVASPSETALVRAARAAGKRVITGFEIVTLQAAEQFRLYTGITPPAELARRAAEYARV